MHAMNCGCRKCQAGRATAFEVDPFRLETGGAQETPESFESVESHEGSFEIMPSTRTRSVLPPGSYGGIKSTGRWHRRGRVIVLSGV